MLMHDEFNERYNSSLIEDAEKRGFAEGLNFVRDKAINDFFADFSAARDKTTVIGQLECEYAERILRDLNEYLNVAFINYLVDEINAQDDQTKAENLRRDIMGKGFSVVHGNKCEEPINA